MGELGIAKVQRARLHCKVAQKPWRDAAFGATDAVAVAAGKS
jgi:hypothetical protein